jgi:PAS domain-containing protein
MCYLCSRSLTSTARDLARKDGLCRRHPPQNRPADCVEALSSHSFIDQIRGFGLQSSRNSTCLRRCRRGSFFPGYAEVIRGNLIAPLLWCSVPRPSCKSKKQIKEARHPTEEAPETSDLQMPEGRSVNVNAPQQAKEALRPSEQDCQLIFDSIPGHVVTLTAHGDIEFVNQQ